MKQVMENVKLGLSMAIIGALLLYISTVLFMPELTVKIFGFKPYTVYTESMEPVLNVNDVVVVGAFDISEAEVGDIITFNADIDYNGTDEVITHYIYSIEGEGDEIIIRTNRYFDDLTEATPDTWLISPDEVLGTYSFNIPYLGYVIGFISSIFGIVTIAANILIIFVIKFINKKARKEALKELELQNQTNTITTLPPVVSI
ncbi:MAG: signal peptidase I [Tenericutes bacterium]|nr:signal peptidase I [Mycoplasmatota bacterium]